MKSVKTFTCDILIDAVIRKYGFESRQALMFARLVESTNDKRTIITMYNKLITNKEYNILYMIQYTMYLSTYLSTHGGVGGLY